MTELLIKPWQIFRTKHTRDAEKCASADLSPAICGLALALVQIKSFLRGIFLMLPYICYPHLWLSIFLLSIEKTLKTWTKSVIAKRYNAKSNFTDAFTQHLTFSNTASILDHCLSEPLRLDRWQVYWALKFERQEHHYTMRHFGSGPSFNGGWKNHIASAEHLNSLHYFHLLRGQ